MVMVKEVFAGLEGVGPDQGLCGIVMLNGFGLSGSVWGAISDVVSIREGAVIVMGQPFVSII